MTQLIRRLKTWGGLAWFPWLMGLYPIIFLYRRNIGLVYIEDSALSLAAAILVTAALVGLFWLAARDLYKAGAFAAVGLIFFFTYGHVISLIPRKNVPPFVTFLHDNLLIIWIAGLALALAAVWRWLSPGAARQIAPTLNLVALVLIVIPGVVVVLDSIGRLIGQPPTPIQPPGYERVLNDAQHPDIYYVILDAYPSNRFLAQHWGYDNYPFTNALEQRGFVVAYDSEANYSLTLPSMSSSLNMRFLKEGENPVFDPTGLTYARQLMADNEVARQLQARGYMYIWIMCGFDQPSAIADMSIDMYHDGPRRFGPGLLAPDPHLGELSFFPVLFDTTMLRGTDIGDSLAALTAPAPANPDDPPLLWYNNRRARLTWEEAEHIAEMPQATFTVVHLLVPHIPIRFDREGNNVFTPSISDPQGAFFQQLEFTNNRTLQMIDAIQQKSSVPPIIIIQGDHGSNLGSPLATDRFGNHEAPYFGIMNAYYFPGGGSKAIYPTISPVNSFRVMFNTYFGGSYEMLDDSYQRWVLYSETFHFRQRSELLIK